MKRFACLAALLLAIGSTKAQGPGVNRLDEQALLALIKEVQQQQVEIADNQTKIEARLADVAEAVRIARIYSSRGR